MDFMNFNIIAFLIILLWVIGASVAVTGKILKNHLIIGEIIIAIGTLILVISIANLWISLQRPPLRTLGETRLWYSIFLAIIGLVVYERWKYNWFLIYSLLMASLFLFLNIIYPDNFNKSLMPALQSPWFIPHVIVYIIAYALLGASSIIAIKELIVIYLKNSYSKSTIYLADNLVYLGFSFLTMGLLFGALWAKEAWGHYWTWDPKEIWAFLTWSVYLIYIHARIGDSIKSKTAYWVLSLGFAILIICWFGVNYLPSASSSVHTYSNQ